MAIQNLSTQYISASFQNLMQVSASGDVYNGAGTQVSALNVTSTYATTAGSAAAITGLDTSIFATTGSNIFTSNQTIQGNVIITGNLTANQYVVSSSVYVVTQSFSSGSTIFGNDSLDTHQFTGSLSVLGPITATSLTGSLLGNASTSTSATSASYALTASYAANAGGNSVSASYAATVPYSGLTGAIPTWNQNTTGNAATATTASYAATASYISPTFISASAAASGFGTGGSSISASYAATATSASFAINASSASLAGYAAHSGTSISASYAMTASYALNGGGSGALIVADEGSTLTSAAASINFVGNAVVASAVGNAVTVTIATGSSGGTTSPGGSTGYAQYNDTSTFAGSQYLTFNTSSGLVTKMFTAQMTQDDGEVHVVNHDLRAMTGTAAAATAYALSGTQVRLEPAGTTLDAGTVVGVVAGGQWLKATSNIDLSTGSLALMLKPATGGAGFDAWLPGTVACVNLTSGPTAGNWAAGSTGYTPGTILYLDASGKVVPTPTIVSGEHVRVIGHVYQNFTSGGDTYATFLFNPDGSWITL